MPGSQATVTTTVSTPNSSAENCGFACHVFVVLLGITYIAWIVLPGESLEQLDWEVVSFIPDKSWSLTGSAVLVAAFFAAPVVYLLLNTLSVCRIDSMENLTDRHAKRPPPTQHEL